MSQFTLSGVAETPEEMHAEIRREPKLKRGFLKPGGDRPGDNERAWSIFAMRDNGATYDAIGRVVGLCGQRVRDISIWWRAGIDPWSKQPRAARTPEGSPASERPDNGFDSTRLDAAERQANEGDAITLAQFANKEPRMYDRCEAPLHVFIEGSSTCECGKEIFMLAAERPDNSSMTMEFDPETRKANQAKRRAERPEGENNG